MNNRPSLIQLRAHQKTLSIQFLPSLKSAKSHVLWLIHRLVEWRQNHRRYKTSIGTSSSAPLQKKSTRHRRCSDRGPRSQRSQSPGHVLQWSNSTLNSLLCLSSVQVNTWWLLLDRNQVLADQPEVKLRLLAPAALLLVLDPVPCPTISQSNQFVHPRLKSLTSSAIHICCASPKSAETCSATSDLYRSTTESSPSKRTKRSLWQSKNPEKT